MKKIFLTLALLLAAPFALATSGACSGHGGVSCSAGPDGDGSVICNDGWRNSSVSYYSMVMCQGYNTPTPSPYVAPEPTTSTVTSVTSHSTTVTPITTTTATSSSTHTITTNPASSTTTVSTTPKPTSTQSTVENTTSKEDVVSAMKENTTDQQKTAIQNAVQSTPTKAHKKFFLFRIFGRIF